MTLRAENLTCRRGDRLVLDRLSFAATPGTALLLRGPNGTGKTTLLRALAGLLRPESGTISMENLAPGNDDWSQTLAFCGHQDAVKLHLSVRDNLAFWAAFCGGNASLALEKAGLGSSAALPAFALSAGQRKRLNLARLLLAPRKLWLLDEPAASLDAGALSCLTAVIDQHLDTGGIAIIATHQDIVLNRSAVLNLTPARQQAAA